MDYISNLKRIRKEKGYTQTEIAEHLGVPQTQIVRYEQGINELPIRYLIQLCYLYKVSSDTILNIDIQNFTD